MTQVRSLRPRTPRHAASCSGPIDALLDPEWFKAWSDPTRALLLRCLAKCGRPCAVGEIAECCSVDLSVVSRHLRLLERAGLVESTRLGRTVRYAVRYAEICATLRSVTDALEQCRPPSGLRPGKAGCCARS